jgi:TrmH family RNA methyltransferase
MKTISSRDNSIVKEAASLQEKKYRDQLGLFLVEGPNLVRELLEYGGRTRFIFIEAGAGDEVRNIAQNAEELTAVYELSEEAFLKIVPDRTAQDIVAVAEKKVPTPGSFFETSGDKNVLVFDRVQDPGNMGTLIRNAEAFGFGGVMLIKGCADPYQPKVVRASAGSVLRMPILMCDDGQNAIDLLEKAGKNIFAACMEGDVAIGKADLRKDTAIIIGNEGNGISDRLISASTALYIPMEGHIESLNAAAAGTIIMYESMRQRS